MKKRQKLYLDECYESMFVDRIFPESDATVPKEDFVAGVMKDYNCGWMFNTNDIRDKVSHLQ